MTSRSKMPEVYVVMMRSFSGQTEVDSIFFDYKSAREYLDQIPLLICDQAFYIEGPYRSPT